MPRQTPPKTRARNNLTIIKALGFALAAGMTHVTLRIHHGRKIKALIGTLADYMASLYLVTPFQPTIWTYEYLANLHECTIWTELNGKPYDEYGAFILDKGRQP